MPKAESHSLGSDLVTRKLLIPNLIGQDLVDIACSSLELGSYSDDLQHVTGIPRDHVW